MQERINALLEVKQNNPHLSFSIDCRILEIEREYENKTIKENYYTNFLLLKFY